jgi:aminoglycoside phosphotransferase
MEAVELLDAWRLPSYLLARGFLGSWEWRLGPPWIEPGSGRNLVFLVSRGADTLFVKQAVDPETRLGLRNEASLHRFLQRPESRVPVAQLLDEDVENGVLVLEGLPHHRPLSRLASPSDAPPAVWEAMGSSLAALHGLPPPSCGGSPPWIVHLDRPSAEFLRHAGTGRLQLVAHIQRSPVWKIGLTALRVGWRRRAATHGDLRLANVLVNSSPVAGQVPDLRLIDWERAGPGDPAADLGWVVGELLALSVVQGKVPESWAAPATTALWRSYTAGWSPASIVRWASEVLRWSAARLLLDAYESLEGETTMGPAQPSLASAERLLMRPRCFGPLLRGRGP